MNDDRDFLELLQPHEMRAEILHLVRTDGVQAAVRAAIDVLKDPKAAAAAKATMAALMFRLGGYLEKPTETDDQFGFEKMTEEQRSKAMKQLKRDIAQLEGRRDVFA